MHGVIRPQLAHSLCSIELYQTFKTRHPEHKLEHIYGKKIRAGLMEFRERRVAWVPRKRNCLVHGLAAWAASSGCVSSFSAFVIPEHIQFCDMCTCSFFP